MDLSMSVFNAKIAFLVPLSVMNPNCASDISGNVLFLILFMSILRRTLV